MSPSANKQGQVKLVLTPSRDGRSVAVEFCINEQGCSSTVAPARAIPRRLFVAEEHVLPSRPRSIWAAWNDENDMQPSDLQMQMHGKEKVSDKNQTIFSPESPDTVATMLEMPSLQELPPRHETPPMKRSRPSYKSTQMPPDATGYTALLVLVLVLLSTMSAAVLRSLFAMSGDDQDQESPSLGAATSLMKITYMQMPDQVHRTLADASSVTLLPPFHPTLVAPPALAWSWGKALRVAGWARVALHKTVRGLNMGHSTEHTDEAAPSSSTQAKKHLDRLPCRAGMSCIYGMPRDDMRNLLLSDL